MGDAALMYHTLGDLYREQSLDKAIEMYKASLRTKPMMKTHLKLSECYDARGQTDLAYTHLREYQGLYEEQNISLEARILERDLVLVTQRFDQQVALMNTQAEVARLNALRQRTQRNSLLGIAALLGALAVLFYYQLRKDRSAKLILQQKNTQIDQALHENEDLLRETHHRVKNNLQIISSMLHLQGRHIKDPAILEALRDSRNRVNSMALIHQSLYREEHLKGINIREYIQALSQSLMTSYKVDQQRIGIDTEVQSLLLDVDSAIPIGLITNELVTNAIKYAFPHGRTGDVLVRLYRDKEMLHLSIEDNGVGLPDDFQLRSQESYGYHLIHSLSRKLKADIEIRNDVGCSVYLRIKQYKVLSK
jgi:two-component sensor histidine kinase